MMRIVILFFGALLAGPLYAENGYDSLKIVTVYDSAVGEYDASDSTLREYIKEGQRQYEALVAFNTKNDAEGRSSDNFYIFSLSKEEDYLKTWVAHKTMTAPETPYDERPAEVTHAFLDRLNDYLADANGRVSHHIYVCVVSDFKVMLKSRVNDDLNTQSGVLASLKNAYEQSKSAADEQAHANYSAYLTQSETVLKNFINQAFSNRQTNHIIISSVSYYQFDLLGTNKLATHRRGSYFTSISGFDDARKTQMKEYLSVQQTDEPPTLQAVTQSERTLEQGVKRIQKYLSDPNAATVAATAASAVDVSALDLATAAARAAEWAADIDTIVNVISTNSALANVNNYLLNLPMANKVGLSNEVQVIHEKAWFLDSMKDVKFIVAFESTNYTIPQSSKHTFANAVLDRVKATFPGEKIVLVTVPVYSFKNASNQNVNIGSMGLAYTGVSFDAMRFQSSTDIRTFIINTFKMIPKPYAAHVYTIGVNRDIKYSRKASTGDVVGQASIHDVLIFRSIYLDQLEELTMPLCFDECATDVAYWNSIRRYYQQRAAILHEGSVKEASQPELSFKGIDTDSWNSKRLRERLVEAKHAAYFNYATQGAFAQWFDGLMMNMEDELRINIIALDASDFYTFDSWAIWDPLIYTTIDLVGFIPVLGDFADGVGFLYASARGNLDQMQNYAIAVAVVGVSAGVIKTLKAIPLKRLMISRKVDNKIEIIAEDAATILNPEKSGDVIAYVPDNLQGEYLKKLEEKGVLGKEPNDYKLVEVPSIGWKTSVREIFEAAGEAANPRVYEFRSILARSDLSDDGARGLVSILHKFKDADVAAVVAKLDGLGTNATKFLEDAYAGLGNKIDWTKWDEFLDAWEIASKHGTLRNNPEVVAKLGQISKRGRGVDKAKLKAAFDGDLGDVVVGATGEDLTKILNRLDAEHMTGAHLDAILSRLGNAEYAIKQDLVANPAWFETFDDILQEPGRYWDLLSEGSIAPGSPLARWGQGKWWKNLREDARAFEMVDANVPGSGAARSRFLTENGLNPGEMVDQVTLEINGTRIRIDYLGRDEFGKFHLGDAKFSAKNKNWSADWLDASTVNQQQVFQNMKGVDVTIKASDPSKVALIEGAFGVKIQNGSFTIPATSIGSLKIFGSEANDFSTVKEVVDILK